jgi:DNA replication and repair protein RecF
MHLTHLSLTNFRNYSRLELSLPNGAVLLHGDNAQGKTNLLEAIYYLATTRSPHADYDYQLLNWEAMSMDEPVVVARLVAQIEAENGSRLVEMRLIQEHTAVSTSPTLRREVLVDRRKVRLMDLLGNLRVVLFLPSDVELVTGPPANRRRYLDITLCQTDRHYCQTLSTYNKVLEQRNAALKQVAETGRGREVLAIYTEKLTGLGAEIFLRRAQFVSGLAREAQRIHYEALTGGRETMRLVYLPRWATDGGTTRGEEATVEEVADTAVWLENQTPDSITNQYQQNLQQTLERDIASGHTTLGPHRDDWRFWVNSRNLSHYGSRGQQRSAILALKMAEINRMRNETGEMPVLLLDEVVAELDEQRRALLLDYVQSGAQALLTATDPTMFTDSFLHQATSLRVTAGRINSNNNS